MHDCGMSARAHSAKLFLYLYPCAHKQAKSARAAGNYKGERCARSARPLLCGLLVYSGAGALLKAAPLSPGAAYGSCSWNRLP